jgi:hypothetical protein
MSDHLNQATELRRAATSLRDSLPTNELRQLDRQELLDLWTQLKRAANAAYTVCKAIDPMLLSEVGREAKVLDSTGWPVEIKRRWETEVLNEDEFAAWAADRDVDPFELKVTVSSEAREEIKRALLDDGEKVPGVSAGYGNPFLALGRGR